MSLSTTILALAASAISGGVATTALSKGFDWLAARRTERSAKVERAARANATVETRRIDDNAALRTELWERIEKLERRQDECTRENAQLRVQLAQRDSVITSLTHDIRSTRAKAETAEKMCNALRDELEAMRSRESEVRAAR